MEFEFDLMKSTTNRKRHGIDFVAAQKLWDDPDAVGFPAKSDDEARFALLVKRRGKVWVAFCTPRTNRIRIVAVRRARPQEEALYES